MLPQHLTLTPMITAAFKVKLKTTYFQELFVQRCEHRILEKRYINITVSFMITSNSIS